MSKSKFEDTLLHKFVDLRNNLWLLRNEANEKNDYSRQLAIDFIISKVLSIEKDKRVDTIIKTEIEKVEAENDARNTI